MKKRWLGYLVVALIVALLLSPFAVRGYEEACKSQHKTADYECGCIGITEASTAALFDWLKAYEGAVVGLSTIFLAIFTWRLVVTTEKLWDAGEKGTRGQRQLERAWVLMDSVSHDLPAGFDDVPADTTIFLKPTISYAWKNAGNSPAFILEKDARFFLLGKDERLPYEPTIEPVVIRHDETVIAGATRKAKSHLKSVQIPMDQWFAIRRGEVLMVFFAYVKYRDVFGDEHETRFCGRFSDFPIDRDSYQVYGSKKYNCAT